MIIGLTGLKGSGKDTAAAYLIKQYGFERRSFADPLKRSLAAFLGIEFHDIERLKNDQDCMIEVGNFVNGDISGPHYSSMTFRQALQRYGTEAHRDIFGEDFWIDATLPVGGYYNGRAIVVTDVRFKNEADRIRQLGGRLARITRPDVIPHHRDMHSSETELLMISVDAVVMNDTTIEDLHERVEDLLVHFE